MNVSGFERTSRLSHASLSSLSLFDRVNWDVIPHKGMARPTEQEFDVLMNDLAKALAEARAEKDDAKYKSLSLTKEKVYAQYLSAVSPDRKALVKDASQVINGGTRNHQRKKSEEPKNLIDFLNIRDGFVKSTSEGRFSITLKTGTTIIASGSDLQPNTFELKESEFGPSVMGYNPNGWAWTATPQERVLSSRFLIKINSLEQRYYSENNNGETATGNSRSADQASEITIVPTIDIIV
ncbi:hypothetical protein FRZ06_07755 [Anoxybacterium hadale]|uniref:Uncharacterized protein n=1 Tax=Anoxybacterium hadale TaxID=3408580 RepID=A0ACD1A9S1_9FIRM|nr:hypothetical protein FRZ06_07755 [Clostridiales bacterium]